MRLLLTLCALAGCIGDDDKNNDDTSTTDDSAPDSETGCGEDGICPLEGRDALAECGDSAASLEAVSNAPGELSVVHGAAEQGCCPELTVTGEANQRRSEISVAYALSGDECDCVCMLDLSYTLTGIPSGSWTFIAPGGQQLPVTVQ